MGTDFSLLQIFVLHKAQKRVSYVQYVLPYSCVCLIITVHSEPRMIATTEKGPRHVHTGVVHILLYGRA